MGLLGDWAKSKRMSQPAQGTAQVVSASMPPYEATSANCSMSLVVSAEGLEPTPVDHTAMASVKRWPTPGATLPITVDLADPTRIKIHWDDVQTGKESAMQQAEQMAEMMKGGAGATTQGAGMDLGAAIQQAAGQAGGQAKPAADDAAGQIERLSQLHDSGALSDEEFTDAKRKLLEDL
ncbi:MAG: SHOCT domain-containing protein [Solirubrobacterales bacterium]|nr:SHOCT domain-containing protein [Solirubrobacterales bacterium]